jgi:hypothetical protein
MESNMRHKELAGRPLKLAGLTLLGVTILLFVGCFYMPGLAGGHGTAKARVAAQLPANTTGQVTLIIGGPGMETIVNQYPQGTTTSGPLTVPSGVARTFTLLANTLSVTLIAQQTADLSPGETKDITLDNFVAGGSQIIVPDEAGSQLAQFSDMTGTGWTTLGVTSPWDVDFDDQGKMYVAGFGGISQMDDISGAFSSSLPLSTTNTIYSIAMDRTRGILYYVGQDASFSIQLWSIQVTPTVGTENLIDLSAIFPSGFNSKGIAVDSDGFLYMATTSPSAAVVKIDPKATASAVATYAGTLTTPWDVLVKGDYVYVSDQGNSFSTPNVPGRIIRMTKSLNFVDDFTGPAGPTPDQFYGPERFVAILNKPITVVDQNNTNGSVVSFNDMTGAGWTRYGSVGSGGAGLFFFFGGSG